MTEPVSASPREASAGALLRAERERQGLHIAALAAAIKVAPRKLDALEHDRWHELPDATFTRALAQTVCRTLKMDPKPVLERLPAAETAALDGHASGLNAPFNERGGSSEGAAALVGAIRPMAWAGVLLMVAAVALYLFPPGWLPDLGLSTAPTAPAATTARAPAAPASAVAFSPALVVPAAPEASAPLAAAAPAASLPASATAVAVVAQASAPLEAPAVAPVSPPAAAAAPAAAPAPAGVVQIRASANSWVEARDGRGRVLLSRLIASGEELGLDGALPIRMTIGNAQATTLAFRGQPVDLQARTRDNVARVELQ
jgi:cytoskeleton protein RodZ